MEAGCIVGTDGFVWGGSQLFTGSLLNQLGRFWPDVPGMWICGVGVGVALIIMDSAVETLDETILHGLCWRDLMPFDPAFRG